jgi:hypothetical protein
MAFSELVEATMKEDELDYATAVRVTADKYPEAAKAYSQVVRA